MKNKIAIVALVVFCSAPAFARHPQCEPWLCGTSAVAPAPATGAHAIMWPPGPSLWGFVMSVFAG